MPVRRVAFDLWSKLRKSLLLIREVMKVLKYFTWKRWFSKWKAGSYIQQQLSVASSFCCLLPVFSNFISLYHCKKVLVSARDLAAGHDHYIWPDSFLRQWIPQIGCRMHKIVFLHQISKFTALQFYWVLWSSWLMLLCERLYTSL